MNFTLYIDESGDFKTDRGQWVLSGVLFAEGFKNCEKQLTDKLSVLPKELGVKSMENFHLTEFRSNYGHDEAVKMARKTINKLNKLPFHYYCLATINHSKSALSTPEKIYRLMLSDLLALCETAIGENQQVTNLDLVVASRTIEGELQTSISNIKQDVIKSLPIALEVDLATKGMVDLIGKHINVKMDYAINSWGLICADFLANLNYHNKRPNEGEFLNELGSKGKYTLFESFGSFATRRASVAERNRDYPLALSRWLQIAHSNEGKKYSNEPVQRLLGYMFNKTGTTGFVTAFETTLEKIWRRSNRNNKYEAIESILRIFELELKIYFNINCKVDGQNILFRLRNLLLITINHLGKSKDAFELVEQQNKGVLLLASNPEYFQMILDFKASEIEIYVNSLDVTKALDLAESYYAMIKNYQEVWQLLIDTKTLEDFENSRANIKAVMSLFRCTILNVGINDFVVPDSFDMKLSSFGSSLIHEGDIGRFNNYKIMYLIKQKKPNEAVTTFSNGFENSRDIEISVFDLFWFLRSVNDALLNGQSVSQLSIKKFIDMGLSRINLEIQGHPYDLVLRELSLFEFQQGNKSKALKLIKRSKNTFSLGDSNISNWLSELLIVHEDYINGKMKSSNEYFCSLKDLAFVDCLGASSSDVSLLKRARYISPY